MSHDYKVGDYVLARVQVAELDTDGTTMMHVDGINFWVEDEDIHGLAPRQWTVGDKVIDHCGDEGEIVAVHGDEMWVSYPGSGCVTWDADDESIKRVE
jgi:hypothetical protein